MKLGVGFRSEFDLGVVDGLADAAGKRRRRSLFLWNLKW